MPATTTKARPIILRSWEVAATLAGRKTMLRRAVKDSDHYGCLTGDCPHDSWAECQRAMVEFCPLGGVGQRHWVKESLWISDCGNYFARDLYRPHEVMREVLARDGSRRWRVRSERRGEGDYTDTVVGWGNHGYDRGRGENRRWVPAFDQSFIGGLEPPSPEHPYGKTIDRREAMFRKHWPATSMPRWASRLTVENVSIRVERLGDISEADCWAEGIDEVDGMFDNAAIIDMGNRLDCCIDDARPTYAVLWESMYGPGSWDPALWVWVVGYKPAEG